MAAPALVLEIDFLGNPSATYYDRHSSDTDVVSYWRLNSASTFEDEKNVNDGVVTNAPTLVTGALSYDSDQALSFNGTNEEAYALSSSSLSPASVSLEAWVKVASYPGSTKDLVGKAGSYVFRITSTGLVQFRIKQDTSIATVQTNAPITTGVWHHLVGVYDGATSYIYLDGILDQSSGHAGGYEASLQPMRWAAARSTGPAPTYQGTDTAAGTGPSVTCNCPAGTAAGHLLVAHFHVTAADTVTAVPSGWVEAGAADGANYMSRVYYKVATGSEPANYTWTISAADTYVIAISRLTGVDPQAPLANLGYGGATAAATTHATGTHLPNIDGYIVLALFSERGNQTWTYDSGNEGYDVGTGAAVGGASIAMSHQQVGTAASIQVTGTATDSLAGSAFMLIIGGTGLTYTTASIDETAVWSKALNGDQVRGLWESRLAGLGAWTDVSADTRNLQTKAGRQYELARMEAGTASGALNDLDRDYDPANLVGFYAPNVIPLRKCRARANLSGVYYPLAQQFVERWVPRWPARELATVDITMVDGFEPLALAGVTGTLSADLAGAQIDALLDKALWPSADRAIDEGVFSMADATLAVDTKALTAIQDITDSELGLFFIDSSGIATFHDSAHRWTAARSITSQATFTDDGVNDIAYQDLVPSFDKDNLINEWKVADARGVVVTARDEVSAGLYFPRSEFRSTRLDATADAETQAVALLQQTAKPALRFDSLTVKPATTVAWQECLDLRISDRVTVIRDPVPSGSGSTITKECFVEGISWSIVPGPAWTVMFQLSPVSSASYYDTIIRDRPVSYWRLDSVA